MKEFEFTHSEYLKIAQLTMACEKVGCFSLDGSIFIGNMVDLVKKYVIENPSKKFRIWLIDLGLEINH